MKFTKLTGLFLAVLVLTGIFSGCAAKMAPNDMDLKNEMTQSAMDLLPESGDFSPELQDSLTQGSQPMYPEQKLIRTASVYAETEDLDVLMQDLDRQVRELGGYVEKQELENGSMYASRRHRSLYITLRIPAEKLENFLSEISRVTNVVSHSERAEDVTLTYADTEGRISALQTEQSRLLELLEKGETVEELLLIEERLGQVRAELESWTAQLRVLENQVSFSTVELQISEVVEYTPVEEETVWQRMGGGFMDSLRGLGNGIVEVFVFLISRLPYLLPAGGVIALIVVLIVRHRKKHPKHPKQS